MNEDVVSSRLVSLTTPNLAPKFHTDRSAYADALQRWFPKVRGLATDVHVTDVDIPVSTGFSNETVFFTVDWREGNERCHDRFVARIEPEDGAVFPVQTDDASVAVRMQHDAMAAVAAHSSVPVPPMLAYEDDPEIFGRPFFVMGFVPGVVPPDTPRFSVAGFVVDEASPEQRRRLVGNALAAMAGIHAIDWRRAGFGWLDRSGDGRPTTAVQIDRYESFSKAALGDRNHPVLDAAYAWLRANDPGDDRVGISWGDARPGNIIWQDYEVAAVVDWEACALSPTEADVGWWLMYDRMSFDDMGVPRLAGYSTRDEMIEMYEGASGREVRNPHYWEVFAATRLCAIFIRIGDRLVETGLVPPEINKPVVNSATDALTALLGIETPATSSGIP
jgi:aminoglycoside phosphotransferase (APT) family kinase protein